MDVAIRGDRTSCLTMQLGERTWLFAVAQGFGSIDGIPSAQAMLARLRTECERRLRGERFRRAVERQQVAASALLGVFARVNGDLYIRSAAHDDHVPAGCSFSATLIVRGRAYVLHAGGTAAYLAHGGRVIALTADDGFDDAPRPLLSRALGTAPSLDVAVSSTLLETGDVIILVGHRVRGDIDRRTLISHVEDAGPGEHLLVVRFGDEDRAVPDLPAVEPQDFAERFPIAAPLCAALAFVLVFIATAGPLH